MTGGRFLAAVASVAVAVTSLADVRTVVPTDALKSVNWLNQFWWKDRHEAKLKEIAASGGKYDFVLIGDSITHNWESKGCENGRNPLGLKVAERRFAKYRWLNLGYGGDGTQNVIWRCLNGELDGYVTPLISILIGTNNRYDTAEDIAAGVRRVVEVVRQKHPESKVLLMAILPRNPEQHDPPGLAPKLAEANRLIRPIADGKTVVWVDWGPRLLKPDGTIDVSLMYDEVHPGEKGYEIWADVLQPYIDGCKPRPKGK